MHPYLARLVVTHGRAAVESASLNALGFPALWVLNVSEARQVERAL